MNTALTKQEALHSYLLSKAEVPKTLKVFRYNDSTVRSFKESGDRIVACLPDNKSESFSGLANFVYGPANWVACANDISPIIGKDTVVFTMHETTRMAESTIDTLNKARAVIFPSNWGVTCATAQGLNVPSYVCPLGADQELFELPHRVTRPPTLIFGTVASHYSGAERKSLSELIAAMALIPEDERVELRILTPCSPDIPEIVDPRVSYVHKSLSKEDYHRFIYDIEVGVFPNKAEGFGMPQLEFAAAAIPSFYTAYGSPTEFLPGLKDFQIHGRMAPASGRYENGGYWMRPEILSIADRLKFAITNRALMTHSGLVFRHNVEYYTWQKTGLLLNDILRRERLID